MGLWVVNLLKRIFFISFQGVLFLLFLFVIGNPQGFLDSNQEKLLIFLQWGALFNSLMGIGVLVMVFLEKGNWMKRAVKSWGYFSIITLNILIFLLAQFVTVLSA